MVTRELAEKLLPVYEPATRNTAGLPAVKPAPGNRTLVVADPPGAMLPRFGNVVVVGVLFRSTLLSCTFVAVPVPALVTVRLATTSFVPASRLNVCRTCRSI